MAYVKMQKKEPANGDRLQIFGYEKSLGLVISGSEPLDTLEIVLPARPREGQQVTVLSKRPIARLKLFGGAMSEDIVSMERFGNFTLIYDSDSSVWMVWQSRSVGYAKTALLILLAILAFQKAREWGLGEILTAFINK